MKSKWWLLFHLLSHYCNLLQFSCAKSIWGLCFWQNCYFIWRDWEWPCKSLLHIVILLFFMTKCVKMFSKLMFGFTGKICAQFAAILEDDRWLLILWHVDIFKGKHTYAHMSLHVMVHNWESDNFQNKTDQRVIRICWGKMPYYL